jgi:hypothetical protein
MSGSLLLTCPVWEALPVAALQPTWLSGSFDQANPTTTSKGEITVTDNYITFSKLLFSKMHILPRYMFHTTGNIQKNLFNLTALTYIYSNVIPISFV